jgi:hypothetical protein
MEAIVDPNECKLLLMEAIIVPIQCVILSPKGWPNKITIARAQTQVLDNQPPSLTVEMAISFQNPFKGVET